MGKQRNAKLARMAARRGVSLVETKAAVQGPKWARGMARAQRLNAIFKRVYGKNSIMEMLPSIHDLLARKPRNDHTTDTPIGENVHEWFAKKNAKGRGFEDSRFPSRLNFSSRSIGDRAPVQDVPKLVQK